MTCCQCHELVAPAGEEWIGADEECAGLQFDESCESGVDLAFGAGLQDTELQPLRARRLLLVSYHALGCQPVRVHQQGDHLGLGNQLGQQFEPLRHQLDEEVAEAGEVAARPGETGDQPVLDRVVAAEEDDRDRRGCAFRRQCRNRRRLSRSRRPCGRRGRRPMRAADHSRPPPSGIRWPGFVPRHSRLRSVPDGTRP